MLKKILDLMSSDQGRFEPDLILFFEIKPEKSAYSQHYKILTLIFLIKNQIER